MELEASTHLPPQPPADEPGVPHEGQLAPAFEPEVQVKIEAIGEANKEFVAAAVAEQEERVNERLGAAPDVEVSFLGLCHEPPSNEEVVAQRFMQLLATHMSGAISVSQEQPYGDILISRGPAWRAGV